MKEILKLANTQGDPLDQEFSGVKQKVASSIQQKLAIPVLDNPQCGAKLFDFVPREDQICAGGEVGKDSCGVSFVWQSISFFHNYCCLGFKHPERGSTKSYLC